MSIFIDKNWVIGKNTKQKFKIPNSNLKWKFQFKILTILIKIKNT